MNSKELSEKFLVGMDKSLKALVHKKALLGQSFVIANDEGVVKHVSAKQFLKRNKG